MATTVIDTAGWQVVVPVKPALDLAGSHLTATLADRFGGAVVALDSTILVPGYDGAHQIDWTADANGLTDHLVLTVTRAMRAGWLAAGPNGLPGLVTLYADAKRTVAGSTRDPEALGRTSFTVMPGTDSPAVAAAVGGFQAILSPLQGLQAVTATALQVGPQGPPGSITGDGSVPTFTAGAALSGHMAVRAVGDGSVVYASADQPSQAGTVLGITTGAAQAGAQVSVVTAGPVDEPSWAFAPGPVWLGLNGALTQVLPQGGMLQQIGIALLPTRLLVAITPAILL